MPKGLQPVEIDQIIAKLDESKLISILRNLIKIPSYLGEEEAKGDYVVSELERLGLEIVEMPLPTGDSLKRRNVLGILRGAGKGKNLMVCAHLDTHWPADGQIYPHEGVIEDGKIYGVGTGDSLSPMAAFLAAIDAIIKSEVPLKGDLIFAATADELGHKLGAQVIAESGMKIDLCIEGDIGNLFEICTCHTGKVELEITTKGYSGFIIGAFAERSGIKSVNAVVSMHKIMDYLFRMVKEEPYFHKKHPLLPGEGAGFYVGPIIGGSVGFGLPTRRPGKGPNQHGVGIPTPTWCKLRVGARYWPGETSEEFANVIKKWIDKAKAEDPSIDAEIEVYLDDMNTPWEAPSDSEMVKIVTQSVKHVLGKEPKLTGIVASGELPHYERAGMDCVLYGSNSRVGSLDEHVTIDELTKQCKVYIASILQACA